MDFKFMKSIATALSSLIYFPLKECFSHFIFSKFMIKEFDHCLYPVTRVPHFKVQIYNRLCNICDSLSDLISWNI